MRRETKETRKRFVQTLKCNLNPSIFSRVTASLSLYKLHMIYLSSGLLIETSNMYGVKSRIIMEKGSRSSLYYIKDT